MHVLADYRTPADEVMEREEARPKLLREAMEDWATLMNRFALFVTGAENPRLAAWQASLAIGLPCCDAIENYEEVAKMCGVGIFSPTKGRAAVSKGVTYFQEANGLQPSFYQKSLGAKAAYKVARPKAITRRNEELKSA